MRKQVIHCPNCDVVLFEESKILKAGDSDNARFCPVCGTQTEEVYADDFYLCHWACRHKKWMDERSRK